MSLFTILLILSAVAGVILLFLWAAYNSFIRVRNQLKTDFADVDVYLKRRASLIENLVETVKGYAKHEKSTFTDVAKARSALNKPHGPKESGEIDNILTDTLKTLFAVSENYPKLRASENFQKLQADLKETEDLIAHHRETYNQSVMAYNTKIQTFPNLLVASLFGFGEEEFFEPGEIGRRDVTVSLK